MYKYEMDPTRTVGATDGRTDRRMDGQTERRMEWNQLRCVGGIITIPNESEVTLKDMEKNTGTKLWQNMNFVHLSCNVLLITPLINLLVPEICGN